MSIWKKRACMFLWTGILCLAACGYEEEPDSPTFVNNTTDAAGEEAGDIMPEKIIMTFQTINESVTEDLALVEQSVNEISIPKIGVEVAFKVVDAAEAFSKYPLWLSNKEPIDLMVLNYQDITPYVYKDMLLSLDALLYEWGPDIRDIMEQRYDLTEGAVHGGFTYGVTSAQAYRASGRGILLPKRYVEETGLSYDPEKIYTFDELTKWFTALKQLYPDCYPLGLITAGNTFSMSNYFMDMSESIGGETTSGSLLDIADMKIYNSYSSKEYLEFLTYLRQWYEAGFLYPDSVLTNYTAPELLSQQIILSYPALANPESVANGDFQEEMVCLRTTEITTSQQNSRSGFWVIPVTSKQGDAAMKFLNLMYSDTQVLNLISWGIEGIHYEITDLENGLIGWPSGQNGPSGYYNPLGLYGDRTKAYEMYSMELKWQKEAFEQKAVKQKDAVEGFVYSSVNVSRELDEIQKVISRYVPILESGSVDIDKYYPEFLEELNQAGMDVVIADKQQQLDTWLARNQ